MRSWLHEVGAPVVWETTKVTVSELIDVLRHLRGSLRVVVNGYEEGYDDLTPEQIVQIRIGLGIGKHDWEGTHGRADDAEDSTDIVEAVVLQRTSH